MDTLSVLCNKDKTFKENKIMIGNPIKKTHLVEIFETKLQQKYAENYEEKKQLDGHLSTTVVTTGGEVQC